MSKKPMPVNAGGSEGGYKRGVPGKFVDRKLAPMKTAEAFVPTPAEPVRMRYKMAGGC